MASDPVHYRVGGSWGVTVVCEEQGQPDRLMGTMQTREDAALVVGCLNAVAAVLAPTVEDLAPGKLRLRAAWLEEQLRQLTSVGDDDPIACALVAIQQATADHHGEPVPLSEQAVAHLSPGCRCEWSECHDTVPPTVGITGQHPECKVHPTRKETDADA